VRSARIQARPLLLLVTVVLIAVVVLLLVRSSGEDGGREEATAQLEETFGPGHPIDSGRLALTLRVNGEGAGFGAPVDVTASGPFNTERRDELPRFALELDTGDEAAATAGIVSTGESGYVTVGDQAFRMTPEAYRKLQEDFAASEKRDQKAREEAPGWGALGIRPSRWLTDATTVTDGEVAGTPTRRVSGSLDTAALLDDVDSLLGRTGSLPEAAGAGNLPRELSDKARAAIERSVTTAKVTVDAGREDDTLRRIAVRLILEVSEDDRKALDGLEKLDIDFEMAIAGLGEVQRIPEPENAKPISALTEAIEQLATGSGTTTTPRATTPETPSAPAPEGEGAQDLYARCLAAAGEDVGKIQECAPLLER
jgi:hypothetical protein